MSPAADVEITVELVQKIVRRQHPELAALPVAPFAHGWDNEVFRIGDQLLGRFPRRASAATLIEHELAWLPMIAKLCSLPVPVPVRSGMPGEGYPYRWSVVPRLPGRSIGEDLIDAAGARALGRFVRELHVAAPADAPRNPLRGVTLVERQERFDQALAKLGDRVEPSRVRAAWETALAAPPWAGPPVWLHGDLHPLNVLWDDDRICAVIDFGDLGAGDPATDLALAFIGFSEPERTAFLVETGADPATIARGRGWAIALGCVFGASDDPVLSRLGLRAIASTMRE